MKFFLLFFLSLTLTLTSCTDTTKEEQLKKREALLLTKEQEFLVIEKDYESLKAMRDSLRQSTDTIVAAVKIPQHIIGKWNGKMICTESNCSEHVIGDLRNDIWEFSEDAVKIINKSGDERIYSVNYSGAEIRLTSENSLSSITLQIAEDKLDRIKGSRELTGKDCLSKYSVELDKIKN